MALSTILKAECETCGKVAVEASRLKLGESVIIKLACGHLATFQSAELKDDKVYENITFSDGKKLRNYQIDCVKFGERAGFNFIIADEQGLGKTLEVLSLLLLHFDEMWPIIIAVPTTVKAQWMWEILRVLCPKGTIEEKKKYATQIIQTGKDIALPGFKIYIVTLDMLKNDDIFEMVDPKTLIIDECQRIKNHLSERAKACQRIAAKCQHVIPMSGTPIKNHAGEYFTILNLVDRKRFPNYQRYLDTYCDSYNNGWGTKVGGFKDAARFREDTKDLIIRRTKEEVLKDLPSLERKFFHIDLDPKLNKAYAAAMKELDDLIYGGTDGMSQFEAGAAKIAIMSKMRHITGIGKIDSCVEWAIEFVESTDRKLTIFTHHTDVAQLLQDKLNAYFESVNQMRCLHMHSGLNGNERANVARTFKDTPVRILIASTLAAGEGLNLQFCSDAVMLERQWNPANEEQAEARFHRFGQLNNVSVTYMLSTGTIDEKFTELVEVKRTIVAAAMDGKEIQWDQQSLMKELAEVLVITGRKKWSLD